MLLYDLIVHFWHWNRNHLIIYIDYKNSGSGWQIESEHKDSNTSANLPHLPQRSATRACRCNLRKLISFKNHIEGKESFERSFFNYISLR